MMKGKMRTQLKLTSWAVIKSFLTILLSASVITSAIAAFFYYGQIRDNRLIIEANETHNVELQVKGIEGLLNASISDLMFLSELSELIRILDREEAHDWNDLAREFLLFCDRKGLYDQIRYLDNKGMEVVRVNYNDGKPAVVQENQLQSRADRYYFKETLPLERGQVFISPFDLNIEHGVIEEPLKPIIRLGTPVFDGQGQKRGIIIFNYLSINLIRNFQDVSIQALDQVMLLNPDGYFLIASRPEDEWGFMYEEHKDRTYGNAYPDAWQQISIHESGQFYNTKGMFTFKTVYPLGKSWGLQSPDYYWKIVSYISTGVLKAKSHSGFGGFFMVYIGIIMLIAIASWFITSPMVSGTIQTRKLAVGLFIALSLTALVSITSYTIIRVNIAKQASDAIVVNLSGRQRMLSQKLVKQLLLALQKRSPEVRKQYFRQLKETEAT